MEIPTEVREDGLGWKQWGDEFSVYIPEGLRGSWIQKCCGTFDHKIKAWRFLTSYITDVEHHLGLHAGESGIRDPRYHFKITFEGEIKGPEGFNAVKKKLEAQGVIWDRYKNVFRAKLENLGELDKDLVK
jgi:hypothetical protein